MTRKQGSNPLSTYLSLKSREARIELLTKMRDDGVTIPISIAQDLLQLNLGTNEKCLILQNTDSSNQLALEHFLSTNFEKWPQELAAIAIIKWKDKTDCILWHRVIPPLLSPMLSQRVRYTILDNTWHLGGQALLKSYPQTEGLMDFSPAFHGLLLQRALQWDFESTQLLTLAMLVITELDTHLHPDNKAMVSALAYIARYEPDTLQNLIRSETIAESWRDFARSLKGSIDQADRTIDTVEKFVKKAPKTSALAKLDLIWPAIWLRNRIPAEVLSKTLPIFANGNLQRKPGRPGTLLSHPWEPLSGINPDVMIEALATSPSEGIADTLDLTQGFFAYPLSEQNRETLKEFTSSTELSGRLALAISEIRDAEIKELDKEQQGFLEGNPQLHIDVDAPLSPLDPERDSRKQFFDLVGERITKTNFEGESYWSTLADSWIAPNKNNLDKLAQTARQESGPFRLCYIETLGKFNGTDEAALKTLDFIRSQEEDDVNAVVSALAGINTTRAHQELVAAITRPNTPTAARMEIATILQSIPVDRLQKEIRAAINDLNIEISTETSSFELREILSSLLSTQETESKTSRQTPVESAASDAELDQVLSGKIYKYRELSSEVKRALRTAQFFHIQVSGGDAPESIDLSPVIDMQYKSLELLFREVFEDPCSQLIHQGILQRRLDVIGYARPIPRAMDEFEHYLSGLPTIREIPFFSKFKLRKMLRAICQFRPGRRFTLDGLKAFALFFLCFGRSECRHGLQGLFNLGFKSDTELFEFVKSLHVLQDARNRAAHEGFHPDASNDIDGIWRTTAETVQTVFHTKSALVVASGHNSQNNSRHNSRNNTRQSKPVIIKTKVS